MESDETRDLEKKVDMILHYLHNNNATGTKGLVAEVKDLRAEFTDYVKKQDEKETKRQSDIEIKKAKIGFWASVTGALSGSIVVFVTWLLSDKN